jgi:hypothetical protein
MHNEEWSKEKEEMQAEIEALKSTLSDSQCHG